MNSRFNMIKAASLALAAVCFAQAGAQTAPSFANAKLGFNASTRRDMWNTVLLVSAGVAVLGLLTDEATLTVLGVAGVFVSLIELRPNYFQVDRNRSLQFMSKGPLSFGVNPLGPRPMAHGFTGTPPGAFVQLSFKF